MLWKEVSEVVSQCPKGGKLDTEVRCPSDLGRCLVMYGANRNVVKIVRIVRIVMRK